MVAGIKVRGCLVLATALALTGCGDGGGEGTAGERALENDGEDEADGPGESPSISLAVARPADLPACAEANEGQLAWVKSDRAFHACADGSWEAIDVSGPAGAAALIRTGAATLTECPEGGISVEAGKDEDGDGELADAEVETRAPVCNGDIGQTGATGEAGADAGVNQFWTSSATGKRWIYTGIQTSKNDASTRCTAAGWDVPATAALQAAMNMGMHTDLGIAAGASFVLAWSGADYERVSTTNTAVSAFATAANTEAYVFCVEE
jgi:hypothetical protein